MNYIEYIKKKTTLEWKPIPNYDDYIVSEYGDIMNIKTHKLLKPICSMGYDCVWLYKNHIHTLVAVCVIVYNTFAGNNSCFKVINICHKDNDKSNNHYSNLQKLVVEHFPTHCYIPEKYSKICTFSTFPSYVNEFPSCINYIF